jgi:hypothetical protein
VGLAISAAAEATLGARSTRARSGARLSAGVPLLVRELVLDGVDAGRIHRDRDRWTGSPSVSSPEAAARLVGRRLPSGGPALVVLQTLALTGQIRLTLLDRLAPQGVLVELDAQGLLDFPSGEQPYVRLAHPMLADALRDGLPTDQRRDLLRAVVHAARPEPGATDADRVQYLHWAFEIDERLTAGDLRDGYHAALRSLDYTLAADIAGALDGLEPTAEAALFHAVALARAARVDEAAIADGPGPAERTTRSWPGPVPDPPPQPGRPQHGLPRRPDRGRRRGGRLGRRPHRRHPLHHVARRVHHLRRG